ncbi:PorT family protein [Marinilongibacter aquaticus]|uniref:type IX secretion/gliding motility protein PorT/SprT n=1 Tax=Marinilongibacter aquaticus TaxID=2975157 RepID=UPI0021BD8A5A|nr:porin family protein [Marinilongibacter aquaticus]UBM57824.1 PorT family protein [Marinilongibacter aquaticus]
MSLATNKTLAQKRDKVIHQADYDAKIVHFGYFLGLSVSNYRIRFTEAYARNSSNATSNGVVISALTSPTNTGLKMGGLMNVTLNPNFDLRIAPTVAIFNRKILVNEDSGILPSREQAWLEIPVFLRYKSMRRGNYRMNMFGGLNMGMETNAINLANKNATRSIPGLRRADFSVEYGVGAEFFRSFFKLAPELHISHGLRNMLRPGQSSTTVTPLSFIDRLNTHTVTFYLYFE